MAVDRVWFGLVLAAALGLAAFHHYRFYLDARPLWNGIVSALDRTELIGYAFLIETIHQYFRNGTQE